MTKQEFVETLRRSISSVDDYRFVNDTVDYYQDYIEKNIRMGRSEGDILNELGNPKLIAKSILASKSATVESDASENSKEKKDSSERRVVYSRNGKNIILPTWLAKLLGGVVAVGGIVLLCIVARFLLPIIIVGVGAIFIYRFIRDNF